MRTPGGADHIPSIVDIFVASLRRAHVPSFTEIDNGDSAALDRVQRALHSLMGLLSLLNVEPDANTTPLETRKRHLQCIIRKLLPAVEDVMLWLQFAVRRSPGLYLIGRFAPWCDLDMINIGSGIVEGLMSLDGSIADALRRSVGVLDLAIFLWMTKNRDVDLYVWKDKNVHPPHHPDGYLVICDVQNQRPCSVIRLLCTLLSDSVILANLWKRWVSYMGNSQLHGFTSDPIALFARILVSRACQIDDLCAERVGPTKAMFMNLARVVDIGEAFCSADVEDRDRTGGLDKARYPEVLMGAILSVSNRSLEEHQRTPEDENDTTPPPIPMLCATLLDALPFHLHVSEMMQVAGNAASCLHSFRHEDHASYETKVASAAREVVARAIAYPVAARPAKQALITLAQTSREALNEVISTTYEPTEGSIVPNNSDNWVEDMSLELAHWKMAFRNSKRDRNTGPCASANVSPFDLVFLLPSPKTTMQAFTIAVRLP